MKNSIAYLPKDKQNELNYLVAKVIEKLPQTEMIILYGSYARNNYVNYDLRMEFGIPTVKISDYDILVVTNNAEYKKTESILDSIDDKFFAGKDIDSHTTVQFIFDDIHDLNRYISEGRYFYTQIKQEGVMLYDSGNFKLARRRKLNFEQIHRQAQEYFNDKFGTANDFLMGAHYYINCERYKICSFHLHQACENCYHAIRLTFTLKSPKQHNLSKLTATTKRYSEELAAVFPRDTTEERRLFKLLKAAYVEARYNPKFVVTKEDIDALLPKAEKLCEITKRICEARINEYACEGLLTDKREQP